jgi:PAS domain S-box-containing protein
MVPAADHAGSGGFPDSLSRDELLLFYVTVEQSPNVVVITDRDGLVLYVNPPFSRITPYSRQEVIGKRLDDLTELPQDTIESIMDVFRSGGTFPVEVPGLPIAGRQLWFLTNLFPIRAAHGDVTHFVSVSVDITDWKAAEEALRHSEARFRSMFENAPLGMTFTGTDQRFHAVNDAFCRMLGYSREELVGRSFTDITHPDDIEADREMVEALLSGERSETMREKRYVRKDGGVIWGRLTACIVRDRDGNPLYGLGMIQDITEQKRMEEAIEQSREELEAKVERQLARGNPYRLSFRELTVLHLVAGGAADKEIATTLRISTLTANKHVANILRKMRAGSRTEAAARALQEGLISIDT